MLHLIASISRNNEVIGYRFMNTEFKAVEDIPSFRVKDALERGYNNIIGIGLSSDGELIGTNGSLSRYPNYAFDGIGNSKEQLRKIIILNRIVDSNNECMGYTICDYNGTTKVVKNYALIQYILKNNYTISNGKLVNNGKYFISAISGEYELKRPGVKKELIIERKVAKKKFEDSGYNFTNKVKESTQLADIDTITMLKREIIACGLCLNSLSKDKIVVDSGKYKSNTNESYLSYFKNYIEDSKDIVTFNIIKLLNLMQFLINTLVEADKLINNVEYYLSSSDNDTFEKEKNVFILSYDKNNFIVCSTLKYKGNNTAIAVYHIVVGGKTIDIVAKKLNLFECELLYDTYKDKELSKGTFVCLSSFNGFENFFVHLEYMAKNTKNYNVTRLLKIGDNLDTTKDIIKLNGKNVPKNEFLCIDSIIAYNIIPVGSDEEGIWTFDIYNRRYIKFISITHKTHMYSGGIPYDGWKVADIIGYDEAKINTKISRELVKTFKL